MIEVRLFATLRQGREKIIMLESETVSTVVNRQCPMESMTAVKSWKVLAQAALSSGTVRSNCCGSPKTSGEII